MKFWQSTAFNDPMELPEIAQTADADRGVSCILCRVLAEVSHA